MAMHPTAVRFSDQMWRLIQTQAAEEGVSSSQFIREAVLARLLLAEMERDGGRGLAAGAEGRAADAHRRGVAP